MGICWSDPEPPARHITTVIPTAPPVQQYNPNYTYAVKQEQPMGYPQAYPQQYTQQYTQQYPPHYIQAYPQQYQVYAPQQRQTMSPATAFVGGLVLGAIAEDILDPCD